MLFYRICTRSAAHLASRSDDTLRFSHGAPSVFIEDMPGRTLYDALSSKHVMCATTAGPADDGGARVLGPPRLSTDRPDADRHTGSSAAGPV
jgi:hypothetical protein